MANRTYTIRGNFPRQGSDLVETVQAGTWPAALGLAARRMKQRMRGNRIKVASFTIEQVEAPAQAAAPVAEQASLPAAAAEQQTPAPTAPGSQGSGGGDSV